MQWNVLLPGIFGLQLEVPWFSDTAKVFEHLTVQGSFQAHNLDTFTLLKQGLQRRGLLVSRMKLYSSLVHS